MKFVKVIYFDESSVSDYMQIIAGGNLKKTTEYVTSMKAELSADASAGAGVGQSKVSIAKVLSTLGGLSVQAKVNGTADINKASEKIAKNVLENTLLVDFIDLIDSDERKKEKNRICKAIKPFTNVSVRPEPNSFSFLMLAAPFFTMVSGDINIPSGDENSLKIDISKIETAMERGRGYYEFVSKTNEKEVVFRFNNTAFRNNYTISDLPKMKLSLYAIYVGKTEKSKLDIASEFKFGMLEKTRAFYSESTCKVDSGISVEIDVYDVVLAGIQN